MSWWCSLYCRSSPRTRLINSKKGNSGTVTDSSECCGPINLQSTWTWSRYSQCRFFSISYRSRGASSSSYVSWCTRFTTAEHHDTSPALCNSAAEATVQHSPPTTSSQDCAPGSASVPSHIWILLHGTHCRPSCATYHSFNSSMSISTFTFLIKLFPNC